MNFKYAIREDMKDFVLCIFFFAFLDKIHKMFTFFGLNHSVTLLTKNKFRGKVLALKKIEC